MGLDAAVLGNHEFDFGPEVLSQRVKEALFPWLGANVIDASSGQRLKGVEASLVREVGDLEIGFFGLTTPESALSPDAEPLPPYFHLLLVPLLIAWIGALALARGGMARALSTRALVLGGFISYSLYMTHLVWMGLWRTGMDAVGIDGGALYAVGVVLLIVGAMAIAYLMWRVVEEPAREWMRGLVGSRRTPTEEAGEQIVEATDIGHDGAPDEPIEPVAVPDEETR